jgi:cation diffusion facilitator family transporter
MKTNSARIRLTAMLASLIGGMIILAIKIYAAHLSDSAALRSDAMEGTVNVLASAFGLGSLFFAEKPADEDHPYGHGKIEYFASAFEGGLISLAGFLILLDTTTRFFHPHPIQQLGLGLQINALAGIANGLLGFGIYWAGKKHHSEILKADGIHLLTDLVTTIVLLLGLGIVLLTGWMWLDAVLALAVSGFLFMTGFKLVKKSADALLDAEDPALLNRIVTILNQMRSQKKFDQIITVHDLKAQQFGRDHHIDLHIVVPEFLPIHEAHDLGDQLALKLHQDLPTTSADLIHTHLDPCERKYCKICPENPCPVRVQPFTAVKKFTKDSVVLRE